ncbi:UNVERIFIED_CONTAM: hypothetical protein Sindi_0820600 [Sesamum indicum]
MKNSAEAWLHEKEEIQQHVIAYFQQVFASSNLQLDDITRGTENLNRVVDSNMADDLMKPYSEDEITKALFPKPP